MKNLKSWVLTFIVWALLFWWESSSGAPTSTMWWFQFFIAWLYLISATVYVSPHKNVEIHNRLIGGKLFDLNSGFYLFPLVMWWGAIYKPKESNLQKPNTPHIYLDSRDLKEVVDDFNKKNVRRERQLTGFWGAFEDFTRQYFGNLNLKDSWWIFVVTGVLALQLANYSIWFTRKFYPENFENVNNQYSSQNQAYNLNNSSKSSSSVTSNSNSDQDNFEEKEDVNLLDKENIEFKSKDISIKGSKKMPIDHQFGEIITKDEMFILNSNIVFIPHKILDGLTDEDIASYLLEGYVFKGRNKDGSFKVETFDGTIQDEIYCFDICFAYKGHLYSSLTKRRYYINELNLFGDVAGNSIAYSKEIPKNINNLYIANWKVYSFDGYRVK